jgi:hypothetical protein
MCHNIGFRLKLFRDYFLSDDVSVTRSLWGGEKKQKFAGKKGEYEVIQL